VAKSGSVGYADPLFELMARTNGSFKREAIEGALKEMLADPSSMRIEAIPTFLEGLSGLGVQSDVVARAKDLLVDFVANASDTSEMKETIIDELRQSGGKVKFAAVKHRRRRPDEIGQVGAPSAAS